ncbi:MAG: hypothetical protein ACRCYR_03585 [Phycicoccus sp.]
MPDLMEAVEAASRDMLYRAGIDWDDLDASSKRDARKYVLPIVSVVLKAERSEKGAVSGRPTVMDNSPSIVMQGLASEVRAALEGTR